MSFIVPLGGHRGSGCTDSQHAQNFAAEKPTENTLQSIRQAFVNGATYVEIDVILTTDGHLVVTHSNRLSEHVFHPVTHAFISDLSLAEVKQLRVGPSQNGIIPTLSEVLDYIATLPASSEKSFRLNIELKDTQGTPCIRQTGANSLVQKVATLVQNHPLANDAVIFSSFALKDLIAMHNFWPEARLGMLFDAQGEPENPVYGPEAKEFANTYLQFTPQNIAAAWQLVPFEFVHPEALSLHPDTFDVIRKHGLKVNTWTWKEVPPSKEDARFIAHVATMAKKFGSPVGFLTDYVPEVKLWLKEHSHDPNYSSHVCPS